MQDHNRVKLGFIIVLSVSLIYNIIQHTVIQELRQRTNNQLTNNQTNLSFYEERKIWIDSFYKSANITQTDKITTHAYQSLYGLYLGPIRYEKLNFLEIGLGCDMPYGPGRSIPVWRDYLPNSNISILEFDAKCAELFRSKVDKLYTGDQSDFKVLENIGKDGPFDVITDDGGHTRKQQINSLIGLWPYVKSNGGIYITEDMQTSFMPQYNDNAQSSYDFTASIIEILLNSVRLEPLKTPAQDIVNTLLSVNCFRESCVFVKK